MRKALITVLTRVKDSVRYDVVLRLQILWYTWRVRRLSSEMPAEMALVVHAFQEASDEDQKRHLEFWFGYPTGPIPDDVDGPVCRCGGHFTSLNRERTVLAIYHKTTMREISG
jgi:hypothetical protein